MLAIRSFSELTAHLQRISTRKKLAVVNPSDAGSMEAVLEAAAMGMISAFIIGNPMDYDVAFIDSHPHLEMIDCADLNQAAALAVAMVKSGHADILMKGLVNTDVILKAVISKENGLVPFGKVMTFIAAMEIPRYPKLLFITDPAVIPAPVLRQRKAMIQYSIQMTNSFGIMQPKIALIHGTEKKNTKLNFMQDYLDILEDAKNGEFGDCIIDGPLDIFLAADQKLGAIKRIESPLQGDADVLIFPGFESANVFYKSLITFAGAQMGGVLFGTEKPVVLTSRSDDSTSKFNSIALACLL